MEIRLMEHDLPSGSMPVKHTQAKYLRKPVVRLGNGVETRGRANAQECAWSSTERAAVGVSLHDFSLHEGKFITENT